jgi:hypothetical protein
MTFCKDMNCIQFNDFAFVQSYIHCNDVQYYVCYPCICPDHVDVLTSYHSSTRFSSDRFFTTHLLVCLTHITICIRSSQLHCVCIGIRMIHRNSDSGTFKQNEHGK